MNHNITVQSHQPMFEQGFSCPLVQIQSTSEALSWDNLVVRSAHINKTNDYISGPDMKDDTLILTLRTSARMEGHYMGRYFDKKIVTGSLFTYPANTEMDARWDASADVVFVHLSHQLLIDIAAATTRGDPERVEILPTTGFHDERLRWLGTELYREMHNPSLLGSLYVDSIVNSMAVILLRDHSNIAIQPKLSSGKLTSAQLRIIDEYIQAHLHQKILLAELASCIHVSVPHFEKMFRAALGCPPYRYVLRQRIERAKLLLRATKLRLVEIAMQCGFASQSHFTSRFTKFVGLSPAPFRNKS
jgi:AraC family transcriptional regulator